MTWLDYQGSRIWYTREGTGDPILLLHHGEADHRLWDHQVAHLKHTHDVIVPDLIGFGASDKPNIAYTRDLYVDLVGRLVEKLDLAPVTLVGACMGSAAALEYAYRYPRQVHALVLTSTLTAETLAAGQLGQPTKLMDSAAARALARFVVRRGWISRRVRERPMRAAFGDKVDEGWLRYFADQRWGDRRSILAWISMGEYTRTFTEPRAGKPAGFPPVCSVWGSANKILPLAGGERFNARLQPDETHVITSTGHMLPLERPTELNQIIDAFLASVGTPTRQHRRTVAGHA